MHEGDGQRHRAVAHWLGGVALATVAGMFPAWSPPSLAAERVPVALRGSTSPTRVPVSAPAAANLREFALNALLAPLIDESVPARWTDAGLDFYCDPDTRVLVDGRPMVAGSLVPAAAFTIRWDMGLCQPLGGAISLSGRVELLVTHDRDGLSAVVVPGDWLLDSPEGRFRLSGPFTAKLSFGSPATPARRQVPVRRASTSKGLSQ